MIFGMYLVNKGRITCAEFFSLLEQQIASRPQLGTLGIEMGRLSVKQVFQILRTQCDDSVQMFGEAAVGLGYLTEQEVAMLVYEQSRRAASMSDLLALNGYAEPDTIESWLGEYREAQGRVTQMTGEAVAAAAATAVIS